MWQPIGAVRHSTIRTQHAVLRGGVAIGVDSDRLACKLWERQEVHLAGFREQTTMLADGTLFSSTMLPEGRTRQTALVICHSYFEMKMLQGTEYALLRAAAAEGYPGVYVSAPGMGDSLGKTTECLVGDRVEAVLEACRHVSAHTAAEQICFVGARFGAAVAMMAAGRWSTPAAVVLWDPALDGESYWRQLRRLERVIGAFRGRRTDDPDVELNAYGVTGTIGFPVTQRQRADLSEIDSIKDVSLQIPGYLVALNEAQLRPLGRQLQPSFSQLDHVALTAPRARHLAHLRIADAQGSIPPTIDWLKGNLP